MRCRSLLIASFFCICGVVTAEDREPPQWSGIYPHLAFFNNENECGTGAVVPWAERLWVVTYAPHAPRGSTDKLYEIDEQLQVIVRPESIGGTPANRMIHRESQQLFIGPYAIDQNRRVRVIPYTSMFGRPTGNARHLHDPAGKIYYATMEEGLYEVDVQSLEVVTLYHDEAVPDARPKADLPGYHGKGLYSGQGRLVYANNGEHGPEAQRNAFTPSGVLAEWDGRDWQHVLRAQFTEVTGPGGIWGNARPATDPIWSIGWDAKSLILMLLDQGRWHRFRLPKASHSYDGAHGWNTEWPRIREIGEHDLLMTMHGMFWRFPGGFSRGRTAGIAPRSTYLKVIGDFCRWRGRVVFGCDDTARNEFLNKRKAKGQIAAPQSQSNLWFVEPGQLDRFGPAIGRGAVWLEEDVPLGSVSDPFLFSGFDLRALHLCHRGEDQAQIAIEVDREGDGNWTLLQQVTLPKTGYQWLDLDPQQRAAWVRLRATTPLQAVTAWFHYRNHHRPPQADTPFQGLARIGSKTMVGGVIRARGGDERTLHFAAVQPDGQGGVQDVGLYVLDDQMALRRVEDPQQLTWLKQHAAIPPRDGVLSADAASVIYIDDAGRRFRIPRVDDAYDQPGPLGWERLDREVATERDLFHCHGTFYELPAENAGGFARVRPISSHRLRINDYCSYRGLLVISGVDLPRARGNRHVIRSEDGRAGLWVGAVDDLWQLGKPIGRGGPWLDSQVAAGQASDPYLMTGYDRKTLTLSHRSPDALSISVEIDVTGTGLWQPYRTFEVPPEKPLRHVFPDAFQAYWLRLKASEDAIVSGQLLYE